MQIRNKRGHRIIVLFILVLISSCHANTHSKEKSPGDTAVKANPVPVARQKSFLDSVVSQDILDTAQVKRYSKLANIYPFNGKLWFKGDTVWYRNGKYPFAIVDVSDNAVCSWKHLLVFDQRGKCRGALTVESDCDEDYSSDFVRMSYDITGPVSFSTTETYIKRAEGQRDKVTVTQQFYRIDNEGKIVTLNKKVKKFTQAENSEDI